MEDLRPGIILIMAVLSLLLRINGFILIRTKRNAIPVLPSVLLNLLSPLLCLITVSYAAGRSYEKDMRSPLKGTIVLMAALLISQYITGLIFIGALFILKVTIPTGRALGPGSDGATFQAEHIMAIVSISAVFLYLMLLIVKPEKDPISYLKGRKVIPYSLLALLILAPVIILTYFISLIINEIGDVQVPSLVDGVDSTLDIIFLAVAIVIVAPFIEELFFRGFLYDQLRGKGGTLLTIVVTSLLFAFVHFSLITLIPIFIMGIAMGMLRERSGSILPSMIFHSANNLLALIVLAKG